ncbi:MAG: hypothetical protein ACI8QC_003349 [Planctomycetota bacterium]
MRCPAWLALVLAGCASTPARLPAPEVRAEQLVSGFGEANEDLAALLGQAAAWAVFEGVEDQRGPCVHPGQLFVRGETPRKVRLSCQVFTPTAPGGQVYHLLVVLGAAAQAQLLEQRELNLSGAQETSLPNCELGPEGGDGPWLVTTPRASLLFEAAPLAKRLVLEL